MQMCVHAIGDRANRDILDVYERALAAVPPSERGGPERPLFRIEHAQILAPSDIPRFAELDVIPSMQALHQTSDMPWAEERVGPVRIRGAYAWRSLLDTGVIIPGGSDAPVETPDVLAGFHAAVTRTNEDGQPEGGWYAAQVMSRAEALQSVTLWPAMAAHQDDVQGRIAPGYRADLVVLDRDILSVPPEDLTSVAVDLTIFDGRIVYRR
jgi:predicted amidohydrolase YtcJ